MAKQRNQSPYKPQQFDTDSNGRPRWVVVGPDGVVPGSITTSEPWATMRAGWLNDAYKAGRESARQQVGAA